MFSDNAKAIHKRIRHAQAAAESGDFLTANAFALIAIGDILYEMAECQEANRETVQSQSKDFSGLSSLANSFFGSFASHITTDDDDDSFTAEDSVSSPTIDRED